MDYELAKELKEAGFVKPEHPKGDTLASRDNIHDRSLDVYRPTLEELIEACGVDIGVFVFSDKTEGANAWTKYADPDDFTTYYHGLTPTEAVARLWLALNKKDA